MNKTKEMKFWVCDNDVKKVIKRTREKERKEFIDWLHNFKMNIFNCINLDDEIKDSLIGDIEDKIKELGDNSEKTPKETEVNNLHKKSKGSIKQNSSKLK
jgi:non-homologous end joining protein Ku